MGGDINDLNELETLKMVVRVRQDVLICTVVPLNLVKKKKKSKLGLVKNNPREKLTTIPLQDRQD